MVAEVIEVSTFKVRTRVQETNVASSVPSRLNVRGTEEHEWKILMFQQGLCVLCLFSLVGTNRKWIRIISFLNLVQRQKGDMIHIYSSKYNVNSKLVLNEEFTQPIICSQFWKVPPHLC